ncbi:unnamed protein product [Leuciscus chuanchicus]
MYQSASKEPRKEGVQSSAPVPRHNAGPAEAPCPLTALAALGEHSQPGSRAPAYGGQTEGVALRCGPPAAATLSGSSVEPTPRVPDMRSYGKAPWQIVPDEKILALHPPPLLPKSGKQKRGHALLVV